MKRKGNILIPIFILLVLIYAIRSILGPSIRTESLQRSSLENIVTTKGLMIKYESVMTPTGEGSMEPLVAEGTRVAARQPVAAMYGERVDAGVKNKLEKVNRKIEQIEKNQAELSSFSGDLTRLEQKITEQTALLVQQSLAGDMVAAGETELVIAALCEKKAELSESGASGNLLADLKAEQASLEAQVGNANQYMNAPVSGVFSNTIDGLEKEITPYNMTELNPAKLDELLEKGSAEAKSDMAACKVVENFRYFVALNLPKEQLETIKTGANVNLRFYDLSSEMIPVTVFFISPEEEGMQTVILEGNRHLETLLKRRTVNVDFISSRYSGFQVSVKSLRTKDDVTGVYVRREDVLKFIPVTILTNTEDVAIVESANADNPLRLYDEVVISADSYEEGKTLR